MIARRNSKKRWGDYDTSRSPIQSDILQSVRGFIDVEGRTKRPWLFFEGVSGTGKTLLSNIAFNEAKFANVPVVEWQGPSMIREAIDRLLTRPTHENGWKSFSDFLDTFACLTIIDDFGVGLDTRNPNPLEQEVLDSIFDYKYLTLAPMIMTTNMPYRELMQKMGPRIEDRFNELGSVFVFNWKSYRIEGALK